MALFQLFLHVMQLSQQQLVFLSQWLGTRAGSAYGLGSLLFVRQRLGQLLLQGNRSMNPTYHKVEAKVTVASLANSSMAAALRSLLPMRRAAVAPGRGAATYRALGR